MSVFIDTSAFYAVMDADDDRHAAARGEWERLLKGREALRSLGLDNAFCFDPHFAEQGFRILPPRGLRESGR